MTRDTQRSTGGNTAADVNPGSGAARLFRWSPDVVRRVDEEIEWALTSNPAGPAEVVGILVGQTSPSIQIRDCQPVFLMRERDRAYVLGAPGRREFERKIALFESIPERSVIGFYRSHMGDRLELSERDLGLIHTCFRDTTQLVLLIKLTGDRSCSARLFSGDQAQILSEFQSPDGSSGLPRWLELWQHLSAHAPRDTMAATDTASPAYTASSAAGAAPAYTPIQADPVPPTYIVTPARTTTPASAAAATSTAPPHAATPAATAGSEDTTSQPPLDVREHLAALHRRSKRGPIAIAVAVVILALLVGYLILKGSAGLKERADTSADTSKDASAISRSDSSNQSELALRANRDGEDLRLDWNRKAPVLARATGGMLTIREGNGKGKDVPLDADLLRRGGIVYRPVHGDVFFRLVIFGRGGTNMGEWVTTFPERTSVNETDSNKERK
jgi:hypothetical protein